MTRSFARAGLILGLATGAACSPPPNILPTNDFNRPTDIAFMCLGALSTDPTVPVDAGAPLQVSGQPMRVCHPPGAANDLAATAQTRTFAFMTNSGSSELSVVDADNWRIVDLDPETGLYGRLPLGTLPEQLSTTDDGCRLVTANRGSCDFSLVDPSVLLAPTFQAQYGGLAPWPSQTTARQQIVPHRTDGVLLDVEPYEVVFLPEDTSTPGLCPTGGAAPATPWRALATFPACDLVALIDFPSGEIVDSAQVHDAGGVPTLVSTGTTPSCPSECGSSRAGVDAGASTPATPAMARYRPSGIAIVPGAPSDRRAYISLASFHYVLSVGLTSGKLDLDPSQNVSPQNAIVLNDVDQSVGSTRIRLSTDPYKYVRSTVPGAFVGTLDQRRYLYVILGDGTLRVVDIHVPLPLGPDGQGEQECETNVDPFKVPSPPASCTPSTPPPQPTAATPTPIGADARRPLLVGAGPGIRFPSLPVDVAAADIRPKVNATDEDHSQATVSGAYAWVLTISGAVYLVNIDPVLRAITTVVQTDPVTTNPTDPTNVKPENSPFVVQTATEPPPYPNSLRDRNVLTYSSDLDSTSGPPRVPVAPSTLTAGPYVETFWANGTRNNAFAVLGAPPAGETITQFLQTPVYFQDPSAVTPQTWSVTWEGPLVPGRYSGKLLAGGVLSDGGANFCGNGVQQGDLLTFTGCTNDNQCLPGYKCHMDPTVDQAAGGLPITGLCVTPSDEASRTAACPEAFQSLRRYEITSAGPDTLQLAPHLDELVFSGLTTCEELNPSPDGGATQGGAGDGGPDGGVGDGGSDAGAGGSAEAGSPSPPPTDHHDCQDLNDPTTKGFTCEQHPDEGGGRNRCLRTCTSNSNCRAGRICLSNGTRGGFCADGPYLAVPSDAHTSCTNPQAVLDQLVTYKINAGATYLVTGTATGMLASNTTDSANECAPYTRDQRDWRLIARIPISRTVGTDGKVTDVTTCAVLANRDDNTSQPTTMPLIDPNDPMNMLNLVSESRLKPLRALATNLPGNPCLFKGGPAPADIDPATRHDRAFFENTEISFVLANIDRAPVAPLTISFDVNGGSRPQSVIYPATVEVSEAARIVLGPIDSLPQMTSPPPTYEAPYLFVVDQRRLGRSQGGGPTRGQLVRINPVGFSVTIGTAPAGLQPVYEDYTKSGNLFPIQ